MDKKLSLFISFMLVVICFLPIGGCNSGNTSPSKPSADLPSDADIIRGLEDEKNSLTRQDESRLELKHWKYGVKTSGENIVEGENSELQPLLPRRPVTPEDAREYQETVNIQFVTADEMDAVIQELINQGYLKKKAVSEQEFIQALTDYQRDNGLDCTGKLDRATLDKLDIIR
ncbi:peptidoglycan-binding domain-containing protein [Syntrophomonas erecta]